MDEKKLREAGIDYDIALERFVGKKELYEKYLKKFLEDDHAVAAEQAFQEKNYQGMLEQVHALKGVTGTLGMDSLHLISAEIVDALRQNQFNQLEEQMERLKAEQERIQNVLREA